MAAIMSQMCLLRRWELSEERGFCCAYPARKERCEGSVCPLARNRAEGEVRGFCLPPRAPPRIFMKRRS